MISYHEALYETMLYHVISQLYYIALQCGMLYVVSMIYHIALHYIAPYHDISYNGVSCYNKYIMSYNGIFEYITVCAITLVYNILHDVRHHHT